MGESGASTGPERYVARLVSAAVQTRRPIVIDSATLIDFLSKKAPVTALVRAILTHPQARKVISTISLAEMTTRLARASDDEGIATIQRDFAAVPRLSIVDLDQRHAIETAYVRAATGLKLPDAAIVATARLADASALIGNDRQWRNKPLGVDYHHMDDILDVS